MRHPRLLIGVLFTVALLAVLAVAPASAELSDQGGAGDRVPDSYIVILAEGVSADTIGAQYGAVIEHRYTAVFNGFAGFVPPGRVDALSNDLGVLSVSPNRVVTANHHREGHDGGGGGGNGGNDAPSVTITSPDNNSTFDSGTTIDFAGTANDTEDGVLTASLSWDSSLDGHIGDGGSFDAILSDGDHTITAEVTDSGGKTGKDSVKITVGGGGGGGGESTQVVPSGVQRIGADPWANLSHDGTGVGVAILDTGIDFNHADLNVAADCFTAFGTAPQDCQDEHGHGTHVAGIVAAQDNTIDVVGVAPGATVYAVKVLTVSPLGAGGTDATVIAGLEWVALDPDEVSPPIRVVNMSLGRPASEDPDDDAALNAAVAAVHNLGISLAVAAGNSASKEVKDFVPAGFAEVMAVASTTAQDGKKGKGPCRNVQVLADTASFFTTDGKFDTETNIGVTISAPGAKQEDLKGCALLETVGILSLNLGGGTTRKSGTSMSAPHVAGVLALMWDKADGTPNGTLDPEDARTTIRSSADRIGVAPLDSLSGSYTDDLEQEGILNAADALS